MAVNEAFSSLLRNHQKTPAIYNAIPLWQSGRVYDLIFETRKSHIFRSLDDNLQTL